MTRIACLQLDPVIGAVAGNLEMAAAAIADAAAAGAEVVVLPELVTSGYMLADAAEARAAALRPTATDFANWIAACGDSVVIGGYCEDGRDGLLYNSAVVVDAGGVLANYRKTHLWDREKLLFTPGAELPPVLHTRYGVIAVMICYDLEFAELTRLAAVAGAELVAAPVNWPLCSRPAGEHPGEVITAMSTARTNRVAVAACDRTGVERGQQWTAGTAVIGPDGWIRATAGAGVGTAYADVDLTAARDKSLTEHVHLLADRRLDLY